MEDEWDYISDKDRIAGLRDEIKRKSREGMDLLAERDRLAAEVDARDEVITELLAILKPDKHRPSWEHDEYRRACEIAGRTE